jgi:protein O-GlcNAc transferase
MQHAGGADIEKAIALFQAGNPAAAARACRAALRRDKRNVAALFVLALTQMQQGRYEEAEAQFAKATALDPSAAAIWANRGNNQISLGRQEQALEHLSRALAIAPDFPDALYNRAKLLADAGRPEEALADYERCVELVPHFADAINNSGVILAKLGRHEEALASYQRCLALAPRAADTLNNRGNLLAAMGRHAEALASYDASLAVAPKAIDTLVNRANLLSMLRRFPDALAGCEAALRLAPDAPDVLERRGQFLAALGREDEAAASLERCLALAPRHAAAWPALIGLLVGCKRFEEAEAAIVKLLAVAPDADFARGYLAFVKLNICDWAGLAEAIAALEDQVAHGKAVTLPFHGILTLASPQDQLMCAKARVAFELPRALPRLAPPRYDHDRIRLAYLSADFHDHATAYLLAGLIEQHDRARFEVIGVSFGPDDASGTQHRIRGAFDRFLDVRGASDLAAAELIRKHEADIAVDLKGFTAGCRPGILASRPAPVQAAYLGFPGTMGANFIDYIIADRWVIPPDAHCFFAEKVVTLPASYQCTDDKRVIAPAGPTRAEAGLPARGFVFGSFNHTFKIMPEVFDVWMRLLTAVEGSVLWQLADHPTARRNLRAEAERRGVSGDRIVFADRVLAEMHLARHRLADLFLDTLPCCAHTTASDALWAGMPLLTATGTTFAGWVATSLLHAIGVPELATGSLDEYETLALALAREPDRLAALKAKIAINRLTRPLFDTARFCRAIESAYAEMHARQYRGEAPEAFVVSDDPEWKVSGHVAVRLNADG